jgi:hypothetical protein
MLNIEVRHIKTEHKINRLTGIFSFYLALNIWDWKKCVGFRTLILIVKILLLRNLADELYFAKCGIFIIILFSRRFGFTWLTSLLQVSSRDSFSSWLRNGDLLFGSHAQVLLNCLTRRESWKLLFSSQWFLSSSESMTVLDSHTKDWRPGNYYSTVCGRKKAIAAKDADDNVAQAGRSQKLRAAKLRFW